MTTPWRVRAPGRVNLIGGHVDFHDGVVVTAAIDRFVEVEVSAVGGQQVTLRSDRYETAVVLPAAGRRTPDPALPPWGRLAAAMLAELHQLGRPSVGFDASITSTLPLGGGLSSSAAFCLAVARAAVRIDGRPVDNASLVRAVQRAEEHALGVACGVQDPLAVLNDGVVEIDCRSLVAERIGLPDGASIVIADSGVERTLEHSPWSERRRTSFEQARRLGVERLRDAPGGASFDGLPLAQHVVEEIARVRRFASALREGDLSVAGELMVQSHASSRDLWRSSLPELDHLADALVAAGAWGARLTGGGFGGWVVALCPSAVVGTAIDQTAESFRARFGRVPEIAVVRPTTPPH